MRQTARQAAELARADRSIRTAREFLADGYPGAYARIISSGIRAAFETEVSNRYRQAIALDKAAEHFHSLDTDCPIAKQGA